MKLMALGFAILALLTSGLNSFAGEKSTEAVAPEVRLRLVYRIHDLANEEDFRVVKLDGVLKLTPVGEGVPVCGASEDGDVPGVGNTVGTHCFLKCSPKYVVQFGETELKGQFHKQYEYNTKLGLWYLWDKKGKYFIAADDRPNDYFTTLILRTTEAEFKKILNLSNFSSVSCYGPDRPCPVPESVGLATLKWSRIPNVETINVKIGTTVEENKTRGVVLERIVLLAPPGTAK